MPRRAAIPCGEAEVCIDFGMDGAQRAESSPAAVLGLAVSISNGISKNDTATSTMEFLQGNVDRVEVLKDFYKLLKGFY